jgi:hypothetical protein
MTDEVLKPHDEEERFVCLFCAMIYYTNTYSDREPFRKYLDKIWAKCPRCGIISYKAVDRDRSNPNGEIKDEF